MTTTQHTEQLPRAEADIVVRQLTGTYHHNHGVDNTGRLEYFAESLASMVGGENTRGFRDHLVDVLRAFENLMDIYWGDQPHDRRDAYEADLNAAVNGALDAAGFPPGLINRFGEQRTIRPLAAAA